MSHVQCNQTSVIYLDIGTYTIRLLKPKQNEDTVTLLKVVAKKYVVTAIKPRNSHI